MMFKTRLFTALFLFTWAAWAGAAPVLAPPPQVNARGFVLLDFDSGYTLAESNAEERMEPASLTKMMTAYVVDNEIRLGRVRLDESVRVSEKAWRMEGSRMFVEVNSQVSVEDLLRGVIIQSGNDASVALAEHVAGDESAFVALMNGHAQRLGMSGTHFVNATGLPHPEHYTTARDMAILARALIRDYPQHYAWYAEKKFVYNGIEQYNRNKLLWRDSYVDGVKTGHTESAGFCLVASAARDGMRLISVVLGTASEDARADESQKLLTYGFRFFETHRLYQANQPLTTVRIWKGATEQLPLGLAEDLYVTVPRGQYQKLQAGMQIDSKILAPAERGQQYGTVNVSFAGEPLLDRKLVALEAIAEGGLWQSLVDEVMLFFE